MTSLDTKELAGTGITVNTVSPGIIATAEVRERFRRTAARRGWGDDEVEAERRAVAEFMPNPSARAGRVEEVGALVSSPGREPSSRHLAELVEAGRRARAGAVVTEPQLGESGARALAGELGVEVWLLDSLGGAGLEGREDYLSLMRWNAAQLAPFSSGRISL